MKKLRYALMGTPQMAADVFGQLIDHGLNVVAIIAQPDKETGRRRLLTPPPVALLARQKGIACFQPAKIREDYAFFLDLNVDVLICLAYGQIVPSQILDSCLPLNIHGSLLPKYRGASPLQAALLNGDTVTGLSLMRMVERMDAGQVYATVTIPLTVEDDLESLQARVVELAPALVLDNLPAIWSGENVGVPQDESLVTFTKLIKKEQGRIDFGAPAGQIVNLVRGLALRPGCFTFLDQKIFKVYKALAVAGNGAPGEVVSVTSDGILVGCGQGLVLLRSVQIEGGRRLDAVDFARSRQLVGKVLG